ncbi:hypothetical protein HZU77_014355 [Neisseriaceae bacterium TC5R-5]|nr:hypothetical protein [Neisseriaceae bacterium TC5R-5]
MTGPCYLSTQLDQDARQINIKVNECHSPVKVQAATATTATLLPVARHNEAGEMIGKAKLAGYKLNAKSVDQTFHIDIPKQRRGGQIIVSYY